MYKTLTIFTALLAVSAASAGVFPYEVTYNGSVPGSQTVQLPKYDGTETLLSVELIIESFARGGSIIWDNESEAISDVTLGIGAQVTAVGPDLTTLVAMPMHVGSQTGVGPDDEQGGPDFFGLDSFALTGGVGSDSDQANIVDPLKLVLYIGAENFDVDISALLATMHTASGGAGSVHPTAGTTDGKIKVIYTTENVPEPATMSLLALGGVAALVRRKK